MGDGGRVVGLTAVWSAGALTIGALVAQVTDPGTSFVAMVTELLDGSLETFLGAAIPLALLAGYLAAVHHRISERMPGYARLVLIRSGSPARFVTRFIVRELLSIWCLLFALLAVMGISFIAGGGNQVWGNRIDIRPWVVQLVVNIPAQMIVYVLVLLLVAWSTTSVVAQGCVVAFVLVSSIVHWPAPVPLGLNGMGTVGDGPAAVYGSTLSLAAALIVLWASLLVLADRRGLPS